MGQNSTKIQMAMNVSCVLICPQINIVGSEFVRNFNLRVLIVSGVDGQNQYAQDGARRCTHMPVLVRILDLCHVNDI